VDLSDILKTSLTSWEYAWLLDTGASCHMIFQRDFFEELNFDIDGVVHFANRSQLKPFGIGSIRIQLPGYPYFLLHNVLYLPELRCNLLSLILVHQQVSRPTSRHYLISSTIEDLNELCLHNTMLMKILIWEYVSFVTI